ncbi:predicted protein [Plenodomus lingam JN3]|uniref:Predicted protein n=1 Tax=Leptosphaeria maculans (strain JN3 / isolate v23.1.3 / race Av1-4-5-6-7-8) TaxID=985895 RepID=E5R4M5_LEPMJ|nr:predicted protein [Plenodomus lingam JN3]CBX92148.1 predicted protein [Plenodomus lingam JN3]
MLAWLRSGQSRGLEGQSSGVWSVPEKTILYVLWNMGTCGKCAIQCVLKAAAGAMGDRREEGGEEKLLPVLDRLHLLEYHGLPDETPPLSHRHPKLPPFHGLLQTLAHG